MMNLVVDAQDYPILYAQDVCKLKTVVQKLIPWHCPSIKNLSTIYVAYKEVYEIDVIQKICLHADKDLDETLNPNELCMVKESIYRL